MAPKHNGEWTRRDNDPLIPDLTERLPAVTICWQLSYHRYPYFCTRQAGHTGRHAALGHGLVHGTAPRAIFRRMTVQHLRSVLPHLGHAGHLAAKARTGHGRCGVIFFFFFWRIPF